MSQKQKSIRDLTDAQRAALPPGNFTIETGPSLFESITITCGDKIIGGTIFKADSNQTQKQCGVRLIKSGVENWVPLKFWFDRTTVTETSTTFKKKPN